MEILRLSGVNLARGYGTEREKSGVTNIDEWSDTEHQSEWSNLLKKRGKCRMS